MTTVGDPATDPGPARLRLDRPVLVGNLVSGALLLTPLVLLSWPLFVIGAVYVVAGGTFLAAVYARGRITRRHEALAWTGPWLVAVALWAALVVGLSFENTVSHYLASLGVGLVIATPSYVIWQVAALAVRQLIAWRSGRSE